MLLAAEEHRCVRAIALIAAVTQGRNLLRRAEGKAAREDRDDLLGSEDDSDLFILMRAFRFAEKNNFDPRRCAQLSINATAAREAGQLWEQFLVIARDEGLEVAERAKRSPARFSAASWPVFRIRWRCAWTWGRCAAPWCTDGAACSHGRAWSIARRLLVASEIREIESSDKERQVLLTLATRIEEDWLRELFPEAFQDNVEVAFDAGLRRVNGVRKITFHDLVLRSETAKVPPERPRRCSPEK